MMQDYITRVGHVACMGEMINIYKILVRKPEPEPELCIDGRIILQWNLGKQWEGADWVHLAQVKDQWQALVNNVMNLWVP
jgi:hypothetical protein